MDKPKGDTASGSSHDHILEAFKEAGYLVVPKVVNPTDANFPVTRERVHYIGVHKKACTGSFDPSTLAHIWDKVSKDAKGLLPNLPLDSWLWGSFDDPELAKLVKKPSGPALPIQGDEPVADKKRRVDPSWPQLHEKILKRNGVFRLYMSEHVQIFLFLFGAFSVFLPIKVFDQGTIFDKVFIGEGVGRMKACLRYDMIIYNLSDSLVCVCVSKVTLLACIRSCRK